jgi:hypothetical protein
LRREFSFRLDLARGADKFLSDISDIVGGGDEDEGSNKNVVFVGIHVRRTDYR